MGVRVYMRLRSRRLFQIGRWHLVGAFHEATESTAIDLVKVLLDEPVEPAAVDFVKVSFLATERYATEKKYTIRSGSYVEYGVIPIRKAYI